MRSTLASAPRSLNEPVRWRFSAFSSTLPPHSSDRLRDVSTGVWRTRSRVRSRASRTASTPSQPSSAGVRVAMHSDISAMAGSGKSTESPPSRTVPPKLLTAATFASDASAGMKTSQSSPRARAAYGERSARGCRALPATTAPRSAARGRDAVDLRASAPRSLNEPVRCEVLRLQQHAAAALVGRGSARSASGCGARGHACARARREPPRRRASRPGRPSAWPWPLIYQCLGTRGQVVHRATAASATAAQRALNPCRTAMPRWTRATARKASFSAVRVSGVSVRGSIRSSGGRPARSCSTWCSMRSAQTSSNASRRIAASSAVERPGRLGGVQARARRGRGDAGGEAAPARQRLDRQQPAALDVEHALALAARMQHEVAQEAGRRPLGERGGGEPAEQLLAVRHAGERRRERLGRASSRPTPGRSPPPPRAASGRVRGRDRRAHDRGGVAPAGDRAREQRARGDRAVIVGREPARRQSRRAPAAPAPSCVACSAADVVGPPTRARSPRPSRETARAARSCRSRATCKRTGGAPSSAWASSISRRVTESCRLASVRLIAAAGTPESCSAISAPGIPPAAAATAADVRAARDQRAQPERRAPLARHQVDVVEHAEQPPAGLEHRQVPDPMVEHLDQRLGAGAVGGDRPGGRGHDLRERRVRARALGQHARADVAVGHDPEPVAELDDDARRAASRPSAARRRARSCPARRRAPARGSARAPAGCPRRAAARAPRRRAGACPPTASARRSAPPRGARAPGGSRPPGCGRAASPPPRGRRTRAVPPRAARRSRTSRPRRARRRDGRRSAARPTRGARRRRAPTSRRRCRGSPPAPGAARSPRRGDARERVLVERVERRMATQEVGDGVHVAVVDSCLAPLTYSRPFGGEALNVEVTERGNRRCRRAL